MSQKRKIPRPMSAIPRTEPTTIPAIEPAPRPLPPAAAALVDVTAGDVLVDGEVLVVVGRGPLLLLVGVSTTTFVLVKVGVVMPPIPALVVVTIDVGSVPTSTPVTAV